MLGTVAEHREQAAFCGEKAIPAPTQHLKGGWLELSEKWLELARRSDTSDGALTEPIPTAKPSAKEKGRELPPEASRL